ncbi:MAG: hypothetical protein Q8Q45_02835 [Methylococcaceae bacterium]|nr:hypothetical protein [Methylococcaceae bacterium]MDP3931262.1 hypothetical protein [Methylococcaceae bacterium]
MKKPLLICIIALSLTACADKQQYEQAVLEQMQQEQDVKDYKIEPEKMTACVVDLSSSNMPGLFPFDPARMTAYRNYAKMLTLGKAADPKKTLEELRNDFGSPKALAEAHTNFTESFMECIASNISKNEDAAKAEK